MPRMPRTQQETYIVIDSSSDSKIKQLEDKLTAEIEKKQNALEAGDNIKLEAGKGTGGKDLISCTGSSPEPEPSPTPETGLYILTYIGESPLEGEE